MTRHPRRTWRRVAAQAAIATLLAADAAVVGVAAFRDRGNAVLIVAAVALAYAAFIALCLAVSTACSTGWNAGRGAYDRRRYAKTHRPPLGRATVAAMRKRAAAEERAYAEAMAAAAEEASAEDASESRDGFTQPLPRLDDTVVLAAVHTAPWDDWFRTAAGVGGRS